jgi:hypothetical protein
LKEEAEIDAGPAIDATKLEGGVEAKSWKCNECGKKFRSYREMQFHANKRFVLLPFGVYGLRRNLMV